LTAPNGLSSLGRAENKVLPELDAVCAVLDGLVDGTPLEVAPEDRFFAGQKRYGARIMVG
jgi:hypothetical protein